MTPCPSITGSPLLSALRKFGFEIIRGKGRHLFLQYQDGRCTVSPVHNGWGPNFNQKLSQRRYAKFDIR
jgi:predicted RNA binding protein YcfA (HicA-like mRNA interferase family)